VQVASLVRQALASFASGARPDLVWFKSLYLFARDEGYPVKQEWLPSLPATLRAQAEHALRTPLVQLNDELPQTQSDLLAQRLADYLRGHTDILID
jgi:hypothetical protein